MASLSKGFGSALSFGSSFVQKAASFTKDNAVKIGSAAAHAGGEISKKAQDGSLAGQGSAVLGSAFGMLLFYCQVMTQSSYSVLIQNIFSKFIGSK